jgi:cyclomaltodextrinase
MSTEPAWVQHVMWWHVYPLGFVDAPIHPGPGARTEDDPQVSHRLDRIIGWLDHLVELGLNGLQLGPVFASSTHGYDTLDHYRVDPRLGTEDDLVRLVRAAHDRGIKVILDGVFNHVGRAHPAFQALTEHGPQAVTAGLFRVHWEHWQPGGPVPADVFEGHEQLVELDHGAPAVADLVTDVMSYWLDRGIDGWRLDAAYAVPADFWAQVLPRVRERHPNAWFTGEVIRGDYAAYVAESTLDSLTQYELWQAIWHGVADGNMFELAHALGRHNEMLRGFVPSTFVGNHDVTRIASAVGDVRHLPHALAVLFTVAGTPAIYAGDEYAWRAVKEQRHGGDDAVRPAFAAAPPRVDDLEPRAQQTLGLLRALVAVRRRHPWLHRAHTDVVHLTNPTLVLRSGTPDAAVVTALHLGPEPVTVPAAGGLRVEAGAGQLRGGSLVLPAHGWAVLTS